MAGGVAVEKCICKTHAEFYSVSAPASCFWLGNSKFLKGGRYSINTIFKNTILNFLLSILILVETQYVSHDVITPLLRPSGFPCRWLRPYSIYITSRLQVYSSFRNSLIERAFSVWKCLIPFWQQIS